MPYVQVQKDQRHNAYRVVLLHFGSEANSVCGYRKKKRNHRQNIKSRRLHTHLINCLPPTVWSHLCWSHESLASVCLVFDGGTDVTHQLEPPPPKLKSKHPATKESSKLTKIIPWKALRIPKGDLWIADTRKTSKGYHMHSILW